MSDAPVELVLTNIASELLRAIQGNEDNDLINELRDKVEDIGQNKKKLLQLEEWLMHTFTHNEALNKNIFGKIVYPQIYKYAQDIKSSIDLGTWKEFVIYKAIYYDDHPPLTGFQTNNKNESVIEDKLNNVCDYQTTWCLPETLATHINNKILRYQNLFTTFVEKASKDFQITPVHGSVSNDVCVYGRIWCESESAINEHNILIEGDLSNSNGRMAQVRNIENMPRICLFPGQMVAIRGNPVHDDFSFKYIANNIYTGIPVEKPMIDRPNEISLMYGGENIHIMVIRSLIYTSSGRVDFNSLFKKIKDEAPHLVILMGPFVSARLVSFHTQNFEENGDLITVYCKFIEDINALSHHSNLKMTKFALIPHCYDICSTHPLPQPPMNTSSSPLSDIIANSNVIFIPNPGYINVNEVIIGITSCDPITSISKNMICRPEDKALNLICQQLLQQRSFFPNYPSAYLPSEYAVDFGKLRLLEFTSQFMPHLFLFSSNYKKDPFVEIVSDRCFVSVFSQSQDPWSNSSTTSIASIFISPPQVQDDNNTTMALPDRLLVTADMLVK